MNHRLDTDDCVYFYMDEFYCLSNFSAFRVVYHGLSFGTAEQAYQWSKFPDNDLIREEILYAASAHSAFKIAEASKALRRSDWDDVKIGIMREILTAKLNQHEYVARKLLETGDRIIIEDSWRDDFWGWGPHEDGANVLGKLWMEIRDHTRNAGLK